MSETQQRTIFGEPIEEQIRIETTGRVIRPFKRMIDQFVSEFKLRATSDGLSVRAVDPANVGMIEVGLFKGAFEDYTIADESVVGINAESFGGALQHARYGATTDDPITISADSQHLQTTVDRDISGTTATVTERMALIDPDSIRQEPDLPDLDFETEVSISPGAFIETIRMLDHTSGAPPIKFGASHDTLTIQQEGEHDKRNIDLEGEVSNVCEWSMYSTDYIKSMADALHNGYVDEITIKFSEEYPVMLGFERKGIMSGRVMAAPRVKSEPEDRV